MRGCRRRKTFIAARVSNTVRKDIQKQKQRGKKAECVREEKDRTVECEKKA